MKHLNIKPNELPNLSTVQVIAILYAWNYQRKIDNQLWRKVVLFFFTLNRSYSFSREVSTKLLSFGFDKNIY